jgi:hypothetical protein
VLSGWRSHSAGGRKLARASRGARCRTQEALKYCPAFDSPAAKELAKAAMWQPDGDLELAVQQVLARARDLTAIWARDEHRLVENRLAAQCWRQAERCGSPCRRTVKA